jgi:hypothetical protein
MNKGIKKEPNIIPNTGTLNKKEQAKPSDGMGVTSQSNNIKLDQDGNLDKPRLEYMYQETTKDKGPNSGRNTMTSSVPDDRHILSQFDM